VAKIHHTIARSSIRGIEKAVDGNQFAVDKSVEDFCNRQRYGARQRESPVHL